MKYNLSGRIEKSDGSVVSLIYLFLGILGKIFPINCYFSKKFVAQDPDSGFNCFNLELVYRRLLYEE